MESVPSGVFDRATLEAAKKFHYQPAIREGETVAVSGIRNRFTFRLKD